MARANQTKQTKNAKPTAKVNKKKSSVKPGNKNSTEQGDVTMTEARNDQQGNQPAPEQPIAGVRLTEYLTELDKEKEANSTVTTVKSPGFPPLNTRALKLTWADVLRG